MAVEMFTGPPCIRQPVVPSQIYNWRPVAALVWIQILPASLEEAHWSGSADVPAGSFMCEKLFSPVKELAEVVMGTTAGTMSATQLLPEEQSTLSPPEFPAVTERDARLVRRSSQETGRTPDVTAH